MFVLIERQALKDAARAIGLGQGRLVAITLERQQIATTVLFYDLLIAIVVVEFQHCVS